MTPQPAATPYDRQPTSDAERVRWHAEGKGVWTAEPADFRWFLGQFTTDALAACAVHDHNVMVAAREQAAMREAE